jgi:hypothetical protein
MAMTELTASRTLVKSAPELWAACSDTAVLGRHLEPFGEIRITRLEPETTVAWEGERASGTVRIEPSGWGTKVTLTADAPGAGPPAPGVPLPAPGVPLAAPPPPSAAENPPEATPPEGRRRRRGLLAWLFGRGTAPSAPRPSPVPRREPEPVPDPVTVSESPAAPAGAPDAEATLAAALDSLGQAHHRPFSRG